MKRWFTYRRVWNAGVCCSWFWIGTNLTWAILAAFNLRIWTMLLYLLNIAVVMWLWPTRMVPKDHPPLANTKPETHIGTYYGLRAFDRASDRDMVILRSTFKFHPYHPGWQPPVQVRIHGSNGYYLINRLRDAYRAVGWVPRLFCLFGIVEAKGIIVEHANGARCETVRIVALATMFGSRRKLLAARYQVPVYRTSFGLLRHYRRLKEGVQ